MGRVGERIGSLPGLLSVKAGGLERKQTCDFGRRTFGGRGGHEETPGKPAIAAAGKTSADVRRTRRTFGGRRTRYRPRRLGLPLGGWPRRASTFATNRSTTPTG